MTENSLSSALKRRASAWAGQLTQLAKSFAPAHIRKAISSHVEEGKDSYIIRIIADKEIAPDARAQEYGSGLHARRGGLKLITIKPKNGKFLAFNWEVANNNPAFKHTPDGKVLLPIVHHPGIQAANGGQGYIAPAIKELKARGKSELSVDVRQAILSDIRKSFSHGKR